MSVFTDLVGQSEAVAILKSAVIGEGVAMTQSWLFTGPPGSGRSNAALAFATALVCYEGGCGECSSCKTARYGSHPDLELIRTEGLSIKIDEVREIIMRASWEPTLSAYRVIVIEDADRLTESAANALLKAIEEPGMRTVWLLCAPTLADVLPTIRSRCRHISLQTPSNAAVAQLLISRDGIAPDLARQVARLSQGHIGRAKWLATNPEAVTRRLEAVRLALGLRDVGGAMAGAATLVEWATEQAQAQALGRDEREEADLSAALGVGGTGRGAPSGSAKALKELEKEQKSRTTRATRDCLDMALLDIATAYRDIITLQLNAESELINEDLRNEIAALAHSSKPESMVKRWEAVMATRRTLNFNVAPLLAIEALLLNVKF